MRYRGIVPLLLFLLLPAALVAGGKDDCLACHGQSGMTMDRGGKTIQLLVDKSAFALSAHGSLECVNCHEGFNGSDLPHKKKITRVDCHSCHSEQQFTDYTKSVHGVMRGKKGQGAACSDCHSKHAVRKFSDLSTADRHVYGREICAKCHTNEDALFSTSDHGKALAAGAKGAPSCIDCHDEHNVKAPANGEANTSRKKIAAMCLRCHADNPEVVAKVGPSAGFLKGYENSVHAKAMASGMEGAATCIDCHGSHEMKKGSNPSSKVAKPNIAATCGQCHGDILAQYLGSIHGTAFGRGVEASATCTDCHGEHRILSPKDASSPVAPKNVSAQVCSPCHASVRLTQKYGLAADRFQSFNDSFHGLAGRAGLVQVANCASCHGVHDIKPSSDSTSRISKANLAKTCGTCHPGANENFTKGAVHIIATDSNEKILYLVSSGYILLIILTIGGMALHNILDFFRKSKRKLMMRRGLIAHHVAGRGLYLRMSLSERIQHASLVVSFVTLVFTGFALKFPDAWWVAPWRDFMPKMFDLRGVIHRVAGVVMVSASVYHLYYLFFVPRGKQLLRDLLPVRQDLIDPIRVLKYNLGISREKPLFDRFSYIEKAEYWALIWGTFVMAATGAVLWFDNTFLGLLTKLGWDIARTIHYYEAWLATLAIIVWHFYFVIFNPETYPINLAFWKGTLTEEEMHDEHPLELERLKKNSAQDDE